jgi:cytochrome c556
MRKFVLLGCLSAAAFMLGAKTDDASLEAAMKKIGPTCSGLAKKLKAKDATASADAKNLSTWFGADVHKYWKAKNSTDGVQFSKTAAAEFKTVSKLTAAGKWEDADATFKKATATCGGCHGTHREKNPSGGFKIK